MLDLRLIYKIIFRSPPQIPETVFDKRGFDEVVSAFHNRFIKLLTKLLGIACGKHPARLILVSPMSLIYQYF